MRTFTLVESPLLPLDHRCGYSCPCEVNQNCTTPYEGPVQGFNRTQPYEPPEPPDFDSQHSTVHGSIKPNADANPLLSFVVIVGGTLASLTFTVWLFMKLGRVVGELM